MAVRSKLDWPTQKECRYFTDQWDTGLCFQSQAWKHFLLLCPLPSFSAVSLVPGKFLSSSANTNDQEILLKKGAGPFPVSFLL